MPRLARDADSPLKVRSPAGSVILTFMTTTQNSPTTVACIHDGEILWIETFPTTAEAIEFAALAWYDARMDSEGNEDQRFVALGNTNQIDELNATIDGFTIKIQRGQLVKQAGEIQAGDIVLAAGYDADGMSMDHKFTVNNVILLAHNRVRICYRGGWAPDTMLATRELRVQR